MAISQYPTPSTVSTPPATASVLLQGQLNSISNTVTVAVPAGAYQVVSGNAISATSGGATTTTAGNYVPFSLTVPTTQTSLTLALVFAQRTLPTSTQWASVTYGGGLFVAVAGANGASTTIAASSPDGITWTARTLPASAPWSSVTYGGGLFAAGQVITALPPQQHHLQMESLGLPELFLLLLNGHQLPTVEVYSWQ